MQKTVLFALAALMSATGAAASDPAPQASTDEKKICKTEKVTGSRTRTQRVCLTEAEWRALHEQTKKGLDEMSRPQGGGVQPGPLG